VNVLEDEMSLLVDMDGLLFRDSLTRTTYFKLVSRYDWGYPIVERQRRTICLNPGTLAVGPNYLKYGTWVRLLELSEVRPGNRGS
jgi:hypothetical protein